MSPIYWYLADKPTKAFFRVGEVPWLFPEKMIFERVQKDKNCAQMIERSSS